MSAEYQKEIYISKADFVKLSHLDDNSPLFNLLFPYFSNVHNIVHFKNEDTGEENFTFDFSINKPNDAIFTNTLRRSIMSEIETFQIEYVIIHTNTSTMHDEALAHRLGLCVIDNNQLMLDYNIDDETEDPKIQIQTIVSSGPSETVEVNTDDFEGLPFAYTTPICSIRYGERIFCECLVKKGKGSDHIKYRPVSTVSVLPVSNGTKMIHRFKIGLIGMLRPEDILVKGFLGIVNASRRAPSTIFSQQLIPSDVKSFIEIHKL